MKRYLFRTAILLFTLSFAISSYAQNQDTTTTTDIVYTGRFLGYSRVPSLQSLGALPGCPAISTTADSEAATQFLAKRNLKSTKDVVNPIKDAIIVGAGDNFSPQLEARIFDQPPQLRAGKYAVGNKELYFSDGKKWYFYDDDIPDDVEKLINDGLGTIPTDNVACFLRAAGFSAIVPGKHDFYFGAERVRQLARFLARTQNEYGHPPVQMLGANLVIQTSPIAPKPIPPTLKETPWFNPDWTSKYSVMNLNDGSSVYPWFSYVKVEIGKLPDDEKARSALTDEFAKAKHPITKNDLLTIISNAKTQVSGTSLQPLVDLDAAAQAFPGNPIHVCASAGNPNELPKNVAADCPKLDLSAGRVRLVNGTITYYFELKPLVTGDKLAAGETIGAGKPVKGANDHFSTLVAGKNYGLCSVISNKQTDCLRFSVHTPFFYFPHRLPQENMDNYTDPDPYVYIQGRAAIFGVVEPDLPEQVGILNFGWKNLKEDLTSKLRVEDPSDALRQQLDYFERRHPNFQDLKILLAQTSPQRAKVLATKFPEFQIVVSAADLEQATSELDLRTTWKPNGRAGSLVAVPAPYFDSKARKGFVHFGMVKAEKKEESWTLSTSSLEPVAIPETEDSANSFWTEVKKLRNCYSNFANPTATNQEFMKLLVLCTMREQLSADVALIQSRDLFEKLPLLDDPNAPNQMLKRGASTPIAATPAPPVNAENFQQMLDRLIWKGDLLTLLYVPGSALKKALDQSEAYQADESATLSLVVDRGRKLETLGISKDNATGEYFINQLPLDEKKIYAVATTDFIGAGDTGYPDLATAALNPKTHPAGFPEELLSISSLVCRKLFNVSAHADLYCLGPITSVDYLDKTVAAQIEPHRQPSVFKRFVDALPFKGPTKYSDPKTIGDAVEQEAQRRSIWMFSLKDLSFAFSSLNNNFSDDEIDEKFSGNPTSSVQAKHSRDFRFGLDFKVSHSSHRRDLFVEPGIDYKRQTTGDTPEKKQVSQISNRVFGDAGFVLWRTPGRPVPNFGVNVSLHAETQFVRPFSTFTLENATNDPLKIYQGRSMVLLPRMGVRWQNREHFVEFGFQGGKELNAFRGFAFDTAGGEVQCVVNPEQSIEDCIVENSKLVGGISKDTPVRALAEDRPRAGAYWKTNFSIPFGPRVRYIIDEEADFLFVKLGRDTPLDTRFRDISKHSLSFKIFPSISIGPTLRLLLYQNKINRHFLVQKEFGIETTISFDIFNRRETGVQFRNKP